MVGECCTLGVVRQAAAERGWTVDAESIGPGEFQLAGSAGGLPFRALSSTHLAIPDPPSDRPCHSASLRIDLGRADLPPNRWAVWSLARSDRPGDALAVQASASDAGITLAAAWECRPGSQDTHPATLLLDRAAGLLDGLREPCTLGPPLIAADPIWGVREWSSSWHPMGRDHALMGACVLAATPLAWPLWRWLEAPEVAAAWLVAVGFTAMGLLVASRIQRSVSLPSPRARLLRDRLAANPAFERVSVPRVAEALSLPVPATHRTQPILDKASIASTLLRARCRGVEGELRLALRTVSWPQATSLEGRIVPKAWLSVEALGGAAHSAALPDSVERGAERAHAVLDAARFDHWPG